MSGICKSTSRKTTRTLAALAVLAAGAAFPGMGGASAPQGEGLGEFPIDVFCEGYGWTSVRTESGGPPASGPGWLLDVPGEPQTLVQSVTITAGGDVVFTKTYGKKTGLGPAFTCSGTFPDGASFSAEVVAVN